MRRIDSHHHLWAYRADEYDWITPSMTTLRTDFLLPELEAALRSANVDGCVAVQARQSVEETRWLLELAGADESPILGVVGWLPFAAKDFAQQLASWAQNPQLKGLRHVVQAEPAGFLEDPAFNQGIRALRGSGLVYDLLIVASQLPEAITFVDRHPAQSFVLDHLAKPGIRSGEREPWAQQMRELARRPNVTCKISGMVTEANPASWTAAQLHPYFTVALEAFGAQRLMIGSDWPVLTLGCSYQAWWAVVEAWIAPLSPAEQEAILGGTAQQIYRLEQKGVAGSPVVAQKEQNG